MSLSTQPTLVQIPSVVAAETLAEDGYVLGYPRVFLIFYAAMNFHNSLDFHGFGTSSVEIAICNGTRSLLGLGLIRPW